MFKLMRRIRDEDEGFTLIELMVVVLIIAILIAIAIPTFLGARERAQDRAAQSDLRNGLTAEKVFYTDNQEYTATVADLTAIEPSLSFVTDAPAAGEVQVQLEEGNAQVVCLSGLSASGTNFHIADVATGADAGTYYSNAEGVVTCSAATVTGEGWQTGGW